MNDRIEQILSSLTLEEKAGLCSGADFWHLKSVERLGLKQILVTDGPHGLRKQVTDHDHVGIGASAPATCFPTAATTACSWDADLLHEIGSALGEECLAEGVSVLLGPGINIKRSPLCGRNFEYFSEDPYLSGTLAASMIKGVQSKGIGTSLKHFAMNNQEEKRLTIDAVIDERAQREIYLKGFEIAVKQARPWTVMCAYNRVDGEYASENKRLLTDILKDEWGFDGLVMSDWGAVNDRVQGLKAGLELEMPGSRGKNDDAITAAVNDGSLDIGVLDNAVRLLLALISKSLDNQKAGYSYNKAVHHKLARKAAGESAVLLKNDDILPLKKNTKIAVIGAFAKTPRYQGAGSSLINPHQVDSVCGELDKQNIPYIYAPGYTPSATNPDDKMIADAVTAAQSAEIALVFAGLPDHFESEGYDRQHMSIPECHNELIRSVLAVNYKTVIVLMNGSPVSMPWAQDAIAILECYLGGGAGGGAVVDILFGDVNPSGKLAETFPFALEDNPSFKAFPGYQKTVEYRESIFVGYRFYDKAEKDVLFPFGHGLSYTAFAYRDLKIKQNKDGFDVTLKVKNTGQRDGAEIIQLYVKNNDSVIFKPKKELRAFKKVMLSAGEEKSVSFNLSQDAFSYYNTTAEDWHVETGTYHILIGASSRDIRLKESLDVKENFSAPVSDERERLPDYYALKGDVLEISAAQFEFLYGRPLPERAQTGKTLYHLNSTLGETKGTLIGNILLSFVTRELKKLVDEPNLDDNPTYRMMKSMIEVMPLRAMGLLAGDKMPRYTPEAIVNLLNKKFFKGIKYLLKK